MNGQLFSPTRGRCSPRRLVVIVLIKEAKPDDAPVFSGIVDEVLRLSLTDLSNSGKKFPLIGVGSKLIIDEDAVAAVAVEAVGQ